MVSAYWEVIGGEDKGGIVARVGKKLASDPLPELLRVGSIVEELELSGNRLHFRLLAGVGPQEGWASVTLKQKHTLLERRSPEQVEAKLQGLDHQEADQQPLHGAAGGQTPCQAPDEDLHQDQETVAASPNGEVKQEHEEGGGGAEAQADAPQEEPFQEEAKPTVDRAPPPKSEVKEDVRPQTVEDWRREAARQKESSQREVAARALQEAAAFMLRQGEFDEAAQLAKDAAERWRLLGFRVPLGVAWDTFAQARLQLLRNSLSGREAAPGAAAERPAVHGLYEEALAAASQAVALLRRIEDPQEEASLASARYTLAEVRELEASVSAQPEAAGDGGSRATGTEQRQAAHDLQEPCAEDAEALAQKLLDTARALHKKGMLDNSAQLAREAVEQYRLMGSRWKQGIAWELVARTQLDLVKAQEARMDSHGGQRAALQRRQEHRKKALAASCKAVALLCHIGNPKEEKDLEAAQKTFDEVAKQFCTGDEVLLAQTLQSSAESLLKDGKAKGALELAASAVEHYRKIEEPKQLSKSLETVAAIQMRLIAEEVEAEATPKGYWIRKERHDLALNAAREAVEVLEGALAKEPQLDVKLAAARCTLLRVRGQEPSARQLRAQEREERLGKEISKHFSTGNREALARTLEAAALASLQDASCEKALELASSAAEHYQQLGMAKRFGITLDLLANAHLEVLRGLEAGAPRREAIQHKQAALEVAKDAVAVLDEVEAKDAECEESIKLARRTLDRARTALLQKNADPKSERSGPTAFEAAVLPLRRTFGYVEGLEKPSRFVRFDVRERVCLQVGGFSHGQVVRDPDGNKYVAVGVQIDGERKLPRLWFQPKSLSRPATCCFKGLEAPALQALLSPCEKGADDDSLREAKPEDFDATEDSDHEIVELCHECLLPLGVNRYDSVDREGLLHGECMAQALLESAQTEDKARKEREMRQKTLDRDEYSIGWRPGRMIRCGRDFLQEHGVPCPRGVASGLMCCIALDGGSPPAARLAQTTDPEAAVNIAYLLLALQVRLKAGLAPFFSLDTPRSDEPWQVKTFGPSWLKGTCVGEVLFQADYHLKELSMGEAEQPIVGMPSVWDFPWLQEEWRAREWFVVRNANVRLSDANILLPSVDIGVEARQQVANEYNQLVDVPVTSKDHPLVKYAEVFTHNFNLIAERKSVFHQLREVTKASILAKFLVDNKVSFHDCWLTALDKPSLCKMEIPFNRLERHFYEVLVCDGVIREQHGGVLANCIGIYGGVDLNIDAFDLSMPDVIPKHLEKEEPNEVPAEGPPDLSALSQRELRRRIQDAGGQPPRGPAEKGELLEMLLALQRQAGEEATGRPGQAQEEAGEEAQLGEEEEALLEEELRRLALAEEMLQQVLAAARRARMKAASGQPLSREALINSFWDGLKDGSDRAELLKAVFNKRLCDRRQDGDLFIPPVSNTAYLDTLKALVEEERQVQERRKAHFLSKDFVPSEPGGLFPTSWRRVFSICFARGSSVAAGGSRAMGRRLQASEADPSEVLKSAKPTFDRVTEDGVRFRIYNRGLLEVRTLQEPECPETVGAVFELSAPPPPSEHHPIVKVTQFVRSGDATVTPAAVAEAANPAAPAGEEAAEGGAGEAQSGSAPPSSGSGAASPEHLFAYFVVYETDLGDAIFTERRLGSGELSWEENPANLEERYSRARVVCAVDCAGTGLTVGDVREHWREAKASPPSSARRYAEFAIYRIGGTILDGGGARRPLLVPEVLNDG